LGLAHFALSDHVVIPSRVDSRYEYHESGNWPAADTGFCLEQLTTLSYVAALTKRIRLLTSVMVLPYRPPLLTAKMLATADVLSGGRVTAGVGVGWMAEEMAALGTPPFERRGAVSDEYIAAFRALWSDAAPAARGEFVAFDGILFEPKPMQKNLPIWVGGEGPAARRRAGRLGDGWYPVARTSSVDLDTPALYREAADQVCAAAEKAGRDPGAIAFALYVPWYRIGPARERSDGSRLRFTGSVDEVAADAAEFRDAGLDHLIVGFETESLEDAKDRVEQFATEVAGRLG
jgi:probable F420-dependent oxidoreductase